MKKETPPNATAAATECRWLTAAQLQEKLQVSRTTVYRWIKLGYLRGYRFDGAHTLYFLDSEVDALLNMNAIAPSGRFDKVGMGVFAT